MKKTISVETAKLLKKAGFWNKNAKFYWSDSHDLPGTDDLLEELPVTIVKDKYAYHLKIDKMVVSGTNNEVIYWVTYYFYGDNRTLSKERGEVDFTLPEALAQCWLMLKKEKLL